MQSLTRRKLISLSVTSASMALGIPTRPVFAAPVEPRFLLSWGKLGAAEGEFNVPIGIAVDRHDCVYVAEYRNSRVQKFTSEGKFITAFHTTEQPGGIAVDHAGNIYVAHLIPSKISVLSAAGALIAEWGKPGEGDGEFQQPGGILVSRNGDVYVADQVGRRVQRFDSRGKFLGKWGDYGVAAGQFGGNTPKPNRTGGPNFLTQDHSGLIYTTEASVGRIQVFTPEGKYVSGWGSNSLEPGGFGGRPKNLPGPIAVCVDRSNHLWVSSTNHLVQQFTLDGALQKVIRGSGDEAGKFRTPHGLAVDRKGCLYVVDTLNSRIQKFAI